MGAVLFAALAIVATGLGFGGIAGLPMDMAKWPIVVFLVLAVVAVLRSRNRRPMRPDSLTPTHDRWRPGT